MRFLLDEDLSPKLAFIARELGVDVLSSHECGRNGLTDEDQLRLAAEDQRCFVTRNARHLVPLTKRCFEYQSPHAGLLLVPRSLPNDEFSTIARALLAYDQMHKPGLPSYSVDFLTGEPNTTLGST